MGVAGCGKSSLAHAIAAAQHCSLVEGDDFHSPGNREKMSGGIALTDSDRTGWLEALRNEIRKHRDGLVLTCSALKKSYRDHLRQGRPDLRFVFLQIDKNEALRRVVARASTHFFSAALVDNQFETLESPVNEAGVLCLDAMLPLAHLCLQVTQWLATPDVCTSAQQGFESP